MGSCGSKNSSSSKKDGKTATDRKVAWERLRQTIPREGTDEAKQKRIDLFKKFDKSNSGKLSYDEVYRGCIDELKLDEFTTRVRDITKRAFNKVKEFVNSVENKAREFFVESLEFCLMLCYMYDYFELTVMFDEIDTSGNMLLDEKEFKKAVPKIEEWGLKIEDPEKVFKELDKNGSGFVTIDEFAAWASAQKLAFDGYPNRW